MHPRHPLLLTTALVLFCGPLVVAAAPPDLPDLDVTHIARTPRYPAYALSYERMEGSHGEAMPRLVDPATGEVIPTEQDSEIKRWPEPGEIVTFRATVVNHGGAPTGEFSYTWYIDEIPVERGKHPSLDGPCRATDEIETVEYGGQPFKLAKRTEGTYTVLEFQWPWEAGRHYVRLDVDGDDRIEEICEINNDVSDATDACAFVMMVDAYTYNTLSSGENHWKSYSFEDILRYHRDQMLRKFEASVHQAAPYGIGEQIRIDEILIQAEGERRDRIGAVKLPEGWDSAWDFTGYVKRDMPPERQMSYLKNQDWGLPHELGHQLGLIDIYCFDTEGGDGGNRVKDENGDPILLSHFSGLKGMMRGHGDVHFSEHSAVALNMQLGRRRGYYGDYLWSLPKTNRIRIVDAAGEPVPNAELTIYQHRGRYVVDEVVFEGTTDGDGLFTLPNRECMEFETANGFKLHPNPYGQVNVVGTNGVFFIVVNGRDYTDYVWLPITSLNLAFWHGQRDMATFTLPTMLPPGDALPAVENFRQEVRDGGRVALTWDAAAPGATYTVYQRVNHPPRWEIAPDGEDITETEYLTPRTGRFIVVADVNGQGTAATAEQRVVPLRDPRGLVLDDRGRWILRDVGFALPIMYRPDGSTIGLFGTFHLHLAKGGDITRAADGRLITSTHDPARGLIRVLDADGFPVHGRHRVGESGNGPLQFEQPTGVTIDAAGRLWVCDTGNGRVQVLDSEFGRMLAEMGDGLQGPTKVAEVRPGELYVVADPAAGAVSLIKLNGDVTQASVSSGPKLAGATYVAADTDRVFVACSKSGDQNGGVWEIPVNGDSLGTPRQLAFAEPLVDPAGVAYDSARDTLIVTDRGQRTIVTLERP